MHQRSARAATTAGLTVLLGSCARGGLEPRGREAAEILDVTTVLVVAAIAVGVLVLGTWVAAVRRPGQDDHLGEDPDLLDAGRVERRLVLGGGIVLPGVVLAVLFVLGVWTMARPVPGEQASGDLVVEVVGHQYWWEVTYEQLPPAPSRGGDAVEPFTTANQIHVPTGTDVTLRLRSADVIHSFFVPQLAGKMDMVPGREETLTLSADEPGTYEGACAEFCGLQHARMRMKVVAMEPAAFHDWAIAQARPADEPADARRRRGREAFLGNSCVGCHTIRGVADEGDRGPDLTHLASRDEIAAGTLDLDAENLRTWIDNPQQVKSGARMPPQDLTEAELDALVAYLLELD